MALLVLEAFTRCMAREASQAASYCVTWCRESLVSLRAADTAWCRAGQIYFPTVYDIKYLMKFCDNLHGGLNKLAEVLDVDRIGPQHQVRFAPCQRPGIYREA